MGPHMIGARMEGAAKAGPASPAGAEAPTRVPHVPAVDGFRAYAVVGIVVLHVLGLSGVLVSQQGEAFQVLVWGTVGNVIEVFFIISGFVLFLPVVARGGRMEATWPFYVRRAARIFPAYWLSLVVLLALIGLNVEPVVPFPSLWDVFVQFTAIGMPVSMFDASELIGFGINGILWFVSIIVGFYVLFPLFARAYYRHPLIGLGVAAAISYGWREAVLQFTGFFAALEGNHVPDLAIQLTDIEQLPGWAFSFGVGMTSAWAYLRIRESHPAEKLERVALRAAPIALLALGASIYLFGHEAGLSDILAPTVARTSPAVPIVYAASLAAAMLVVLLGPGWMRRPFVNEPARRLAEISYAVFLIHVLAGIYVGLTLLGLPSDGTLGAFLMMFAVTMAASCAYGWVSLRLVERPARAWASRYTRRYGSSRPRRKSAEAPEPLPSGPAGQR